jgi:hypothetical protein
VAMQECMRVRKLLAERYGSAGFRVSVDCAKRRDVKLVICHDRISRADILQFLRERGYWHLKQDGESIVGYINQKNNSLCVYA